MNIINFLNSELYTTAISSFSEKYKLKICKLEERKYDSYERNSSEELASAQLSLKEIVDILETELDKILNFAYLNILKFSGEDDDGEFKGYSYVFIFNFAVRYHIMKYNSEYFEEYSKKIRMPGAKQYTKQVKKIYEQVINENN